MAIFTISDTHFWHTNIIQLCNRPYTSVQDMNADMIYKWNNRVDPTDTVIHVGDFAFTNDINKIKEIVEQLNGFKILILGNHDLGRTKMSKAGFQIVTQKLVIDDITFVHRPPSTTNYNRPDRVVYGHVHNNPHARPCRKCYNASVEVNGYTPQCIGNLKWTK